jgi:hypothetical protein
MATKWKGRLALVNQPTGDGRRFKAGGVSNRALPQPINWQRQSSEGHLTSVTVGSIQELEISDEWVDGSGVMFDDAESESLRADVQRVMELIRQGVVGPSVDPGAVQAVEVLAGTDEPLTWGMFEAALDEEDGEFPDVELLFTHYEIAGATLVSTPAFSGVTFQLEEDPEMEAAALVAAVIGSTDLPVAGRDRSWDGDAAASRVFELFTGDDGAVDVSGVARAFLWRDSEGDPQDRGSYKLPFADVLNGHLEIIPAGVMATAGGRGVSAASIPDTDRAKVESRVCALYDRVRREFEDWPVCPFDQDDVDASAEAATQASRAAAPLASVDLFMDPKLDQITALAREDLGNGLVRVFGHLTDPNSCHRGFRDQCMTPPESQTDYGLFHRYPFDTAEGPITVGRVTSGLGQVGNSCSHLGCRGLDDHACVDFEFLDAVKHHDGLKTLAWVRVGVDNERIPGAIWFSGVEVPGLGEAERAVLARRRVSGDWRDLGATRELCEVLALAREEPGFEVPRVAVGYRDGRQVSLVAASQVCPRPVHVPEPQAPTVVPGAERTVEMSAANMVAGTDRARTSEEVAEAAAVVRRARQARARVAMLTLQLKKFK